jgi:hypothetical protein
MTLEAPEKTELNPDRLQLVKFVFGTDKKGDGVEVLKCGWEKFTTIFSKQGS